MRSASTGRLRKAMRMERSNLSRSKGSREPALLITVSSRSCTRSKVVKRAPQPGQKRRRRIAELSSVGRESFTWVSSLPQNGQRIHKSSPVQSVGPVFLKAGIDREALAQFPYPCPDPLFGDIVIFRICRPEGVQHLDDHLADLGEFRAAEATRRRRRAAETHT